MQTVDDKRKQMMAQLDDMFEFSRKIGPKEQDLTQNWDNQSIFIRPGINAPLWIEKIAESKENTNVLMLLQVKTHLGFWQNGILDKARLVCFLKGRTLAPYSAALVWYPTKETRQDVKEVKRLLSKFGVTVSL